MDWFLSGLGNARGVVESHDVTVRADPTSRCRVPAPTDPLSQGSLSIRSVRGKLGDSDDSLLFLGTAIDPSREGFCMSARLRVTRTGDDLGWQSGYGLFALDSVSCQDSSCRHRNMLAAGRFRALVPDACACGLRLVAGHSDARAKEYGTGRRLDASRVFPASTLGPSISVGESLVVELSKVDGGFVARACSETPFGEVRVNGCDFLTAQDEGAIYVGIGVAGDIDVEVSELAFSITSGRLSHTPEDEIQLRIPDYPFSRDLPCMAVEPLEGSVRRGVLYAAPDGTPQGTGDERSPLDLQSALCMAGERTRVVLLDGTYRSAAPIVAPRCPDARRHGRREVVALHDGHAVVDGSALAVKAPVMVVRGDGWHVRGLAIQKGPSVGLLVCGSDNVIERCQAHDNGDTGILICGYPGSPRESWPSRNLVHACDSYDNCDAARTNADGFGAKLRVGSGNRFEGCIAHHNADDGFDLYSKSVIGPIGPVRLSGCVAYSNGHVRSTEGPRRDARGTGFKLGGENQPVPHVVTRCIAYENDRAGFSSNSNPSPVISDVIAWENGSKATRDGIKLTTGRSDMVPTWRVSRAVVGGWASMSEDELSRTFANHDTSIAPTRRRNGSIDMNGLFKIVGRWPTKLRYQGPGVADPPLRNVVPSSLSRGVLGSKRKRVMFVVPRISGGGAEKVITSLASRMANHHEVCLVTTAKEDGQPGYPLSSKVTYVNLHDWAVANRGQGTGRRAMRLLRAAVGGARVLVSALVARVALLVGPSGVREKKARAAEAHKLAYQAACLMAVKREFRPDCSISFLNSANHVNVASRCGERCVISIRSHIDGPFAPAECQTDEGRARIEEACRGADTVVAVSEELALALERDFDLPSDKIEVIYNGIDADDVRETAEEPLEDVALGAAIDRAPFVFVSTGRLTRKKGPWHLVRAFSRVVERHPDALLVLLGKEGRREENVAGLVRETIRSLGLEDNVVVPGFHENPHAVVAKCDAFVSASLNEGFPNALIEAMALGLPVISSDCSSGPREILAPDTDCLAKATTVSVEQFGLLVPVCSGKRLVTEPLEAEEEILAEAMCRVMEDDALRERLSAASVDRARQLSSDVFLSKWEEVVAHGSQS